MVMFESFTLCAWNKYVGSLILPECAKCYHLYIGAKFDSFVLEQRESYLGCLNYDSGQRAHTKHRCVPIMIGSFLDTQIRGLEAVENMRALWGSMIMEGVPRLYSTFSTFDALSMHVRQTKAEGKCIDWYLYIDGADLTGVGTNNNNNNNTQEGLSITYSQNTRTLSYTFRNVTRVCGTSAEMQNKPDRASDDGGGGSSSGEEEEIAKQIPSWIELLNRANPFVSQGNAVSSSEYFRMFDVILQHPYDMNNLQNRQLICSSRIIRKVIDMDMKERAAKSGRGCGKLTKLFESGCLYAALSKKNARNQQEQFRSYGQNFDCTLHDGRSSKTAYLLQTITRQCKESILNNVKAQQFPPDAMNFICPLSTKDMKRVGEQHMLADLVIMTNETDEQKLFAALCRGNWSTHPSEVVKHVIINGFITRKRICMHLENVIKLKAEFPHVTLKFYGEYVLFSTKNSIPIAYFEEFDTFFSPAEQEYFALKYPEEHTYSLFVKQMPKSAIERTLAAQLTVSINNEKGSIAICNGESHRKFMENTLGSTCYMYAEKDPNRLLKVITRPASDAERAEVSTWHARIQEAYTGILNVGERTSLCSSSEPLSDNNNNNNNNSQEPSPEQISKINRAVLRMFDGLEFLFDQIPAKIPNYKHINRVQSYANMVVGSKHYHPPPIWNLRLWACFGHFHGAGIEDAVILDQSVTKHGPTIHYNVCFTVDFIFETSKQASELDSRFVPINSVSSSQEWDGVATIVPDSRETLIGCLVSRHKVTVKCSNHCHVDEGSIGSANYYFLHFHPKGQSMYQHLRVTHSKRQKTITVTIKGRRQNSLGVGSKLANAFGQKNVVSMVGDLSSFWGVTKDGRKVHPQIMYSTVSIVGRIASGQVFHMLTHPDVATTSLGGIIAPIDLVIHYLDPHTNVKLSSIKADTFTNINGFDSQNLPTVSASIRAQSGQRVLPKMLQLVGLHGFELIPAPHGGGNMECKEEQAKTKQRQGRLLLNNSLLTRKTLQENQTTTTTTKAQFSAQQINPKNEPLKKHYNAAASSPLILEHTEIADYIVKRKANSSHLVSGEAEADCIADQENIETKFYNPASPKLEASELNDDDDDDDDNDDATDDDDDDDDDNGGGGDGAEEEDDEIKLYFSTLSGGDDDNDDNDDGGGGVSDNGETANEKDDAYEHFLSVEPQNTNIESPTTTTTTTTTPHTSSVILKSRKQITTSLSCDLPSLHYLSNQSQCENNQDGNNVKCDPCRSTCHGSAERRVTTTTRKTRRRGEDQENENGKLGEETPAGAKRQRSECNTENC